MDEKLQKLLKELGDAINDSISSSDSVNQHIQRIKDHGYNLYVVLDATIGLDKEGEEIPDSISLTEDAREKPHPVQFRINVNDLSFLRSLGIDPTRKVAKGKRVRKSPPPEEQ